MFGLRGAFSGAFQRMAFARPNVPSACSTPSLMPIVPSFGGLLSNFQVVRFMNRNARRPKKANHGKRPVSHCRRHEKRKQLRSAAYAKKIFGFW